MNKLINAVALAGMSPATCAVLAALQRDMKRVYDIVPRIPLDASIDAALKIGADALKVSKITYPQIPKMPQLPKMMELP